MLVFKIKACISQHTTQEHDTMQLTIKQAHIPPKFKDNRMWTTNYKIFDFGQILEYGNMSYDQ